MQDHEIKDLLIKTCQVRPGQESRAWSSLRQELFAAERRTSGWAWMWSWPRATVGALAVAAAVLNLDLFLSHFSSRSLATADSESPGIYATAFYSPSAEAQVVWLNGMDAASDRPTYLDPTTVVAQPATGPKTPTGDPNSL